MKYISILIMFVIMASANTVSAAESADFEDAAIDMVKSITAYQFDTKLPKQSFSDWFEKIVGSKAEISWEMNDCGEQTGDPASDSERDFPACVEARALLPDDREVIVYIAVGTFKKGIKEPIEFHSASVEGEKSYAVYRLSDLPGMLKKAR